MLVYGHEDVVEGFGEFFCESCYQPFDDISVHLTVFFFIFFILFKISSLVGAKFEKSSLWSVLSSNGVNSWDMRLKKVADFSAISVSDNSGNIWSIDQAAGASSDWSVLIAW